MRLGRARVAFLESLHPTRDYDNRLADGGASLPCARVASAAGPSRRSVCLKPSGEFADHYSGELLPVIAMHAIVVLALASGLSAQIAQALDLRMARRFQRIVDLSKMDEGVATPLLTAEIQAEQTGYLRRTVADLVSRVDVGGRSARKALVRLIALAFEPNAKTVMMGAGVLGSAARLMKSAASTDEVQGLAGSLITLLTGMPVVSEISDDKTGASGRVNVVLPRPSRVYGPDMTLLELGVGVPPGQAVLRS